VKFLVDVNLPPRLCDWLRQRGQEASHLSDFASLSTPDREVWRLATTRSEVIVSKDVDFYERSLLLGKPPQVLHIAVGNCSNDDLLGILDQFWTTTLSELSAGARLISIHRDRLEIHA